MNISYEWLSTLVDAGTPAEVAKTLTMAGLEVEALKNPFAGLSGVIVASIRSIRQHPNASSLKLCEIDVGTGLVTVVCGATNIFQGAMVPWMKPGSKTASGRAVEAVTIRGEKSEGMLAAKEDLGLEEKSTGIWILPSGLNCGETIELALGNGAEVMEVNVTPNRGDALSHLGVAREVSAVRGVPLRRPDVSIAESGEQAADIVSVEIWDPEGCPRYLCRVVRGIKIGPSPDWMARRLEAAGVRPINNLVDATNYVMLELGHPMHAFDLRKLQGGKIVVRRAAAGEKLVTIDGIERVLEPTDLVITDTGGPVALAGVMGGLASGISETTADLLLECACFEPVGIRKTSSRLGLASESSYRFERGVDPAGLEFALDRCARLVQETGGGTVFSGRPGAGAVPVRKMAMLRSSRLNMLSGIEIDFAEAVRILVSLGFEKASEGEGQVEFFVPTFRPDVSMEADLIEEVVRINGYDKIVPTLPAAREFHEAGREAPDLISRIRELMTGAGLQEVINYSFIPSGAAAALGISGAPLRVRNPLSEDQAEMRLSLLPGLVANVRHNIRRQQRSLKLFEIGRAYLPRAGEALPVESERLGVIICGNRTEMTWSLPEAAVDFFDLKGLCEIIASGLRVSGLRLEPTGIPPFLHPGRSARVTVGGKEAGLIGQLHPGLAAGFDITIPVFVLELEISALAGASARDATYTPYTDFPRVERDVALVVGENVAAGELTSAVEALGIPEVASVTIFDVYTGAQVGGGRKNVALSITYRAADRTLRDEEVDAMHGRIVSSLSEKFGGALRG
jgi:phenylalanyl-tRNA synthetase beta chain